MTPTPQVPPGGYNCEQVWRLLYEYLDGGLDQAKRDRVTAHLKYCLHCRTAAELSEQVHVLVAELGPEAAPSDLRVKLGAMLKAEDHPAEEDLPGTFPAHETEMERVKRLSRFSTRKREPTIWTNADVSDADAAQARDEMGVPEPVPAAVRTAGPPGPPGHSRGAGALPPLPESTIDADALLPAPPARKANVTTFYLLGIGAALIIAVMVVLIARQLPAAGPTPPPRSFVETLLTTDIPLAPLLKNGSAAFTEQTLRHDPLVTWPVVLPEFEDPNAAYVAAQVIDAGGVPVTLASFRRHNTLCAVVSTGWDHGRTIDGQALLKPLDVDGYPFQVVTDGPRQLALWTQPIDQSTVLYGLLVTGVNPDALAEMALETRLEALHRINTQAGLVPGE